MGIKRLVLKYRYYIIGFIVYQMLGWFFVKLLFNGGYISESDLHGLADGAGESFKRLFHLP